MTKKIKLTLVSFFLIIFVGNVKAFDVVKPTQEFYINDYASIINPNTQKELQNKSINLYEEKGVQIVILTLHSLDGIPIEDYANKFYNDNQIGSKETSGILIILSCSERNIRVEIGDHLEGILPDSKVGRLIDTYAIPHLKDNEYSKALESLYNALYDVVNENELSYTKEENVIPSNIIKINIAVSAGAGILSSFIPIFNILFIIFLVLEFIYLSFTIGTSFFFAFLALDLVVFFVFHIWLRMKPGYSSYGGSSYHSSSSSSHSYSGGGGHSSGGGASRKF